jgi:hypothetical protein
MLTNPYTVPMLTLQNLRAGRLGLVVTFAATALAVAGCSSGGSSAPSWAAALGSDTTVTGPQSVAPGHGSPGAAVQGYVTSLTNKDAAGACGYVDPTAQASCKSSLTQAPKDQLPYFKNEALGYVVTHGTQALAGITGSLCAPGSTPECSSTNSDPAAIFSSAKPFATLWSQALAASNSSNSNAYSLAPCIEVSGQWYIDISSSS